MVREENNVMVARKIESFREEFVATVLITGEPVCGRTA